jgi:hypothetical protein
VSRYWVIAPFHADDPEVFDAIWSFDLKEGIISIGWAELGDISRLTEADIRDALCRKWPGYADASGAATSAARMMHKFYHSIVPGDVVIARCGTKRIAAIGTVTRAAYYDPKKLKSLVKPFGTEYEQHAYPHHIGVVWESGNRDIEYEDIVFGLQTLYEIPAEKYRWLMEEEVEERSTEFQSEEPTSGQVEFALEKYLEDFIVSNFDAVFHGRLKLITDVDGTAIGQQYQTDVGVIDILAQDLKTNALVVIELKKGHKADSVVGQVLRYMGWVAENLARGGQDVHGIVICKEVDEKLTYALKMVNNVSAKTYQVDFKLNDQ